MRLDWTCDCGKGHPWTPWKQGARVTCDCGAVFSTTHTPGEVPNPRLGERVLGPLAGAPNVVPSGEVGTVGKVSKSRAKK